MVQNTYLDGRAVSYYRDLEFQVILNI